MNSLKLSHVSFEKCRTIPAASNAETMFSVVQEISIPFKILLNESACVDNDIFKCLLVVVSFFWAAKMTKSNGCVRWELNFLYVEEDK